MAEGSPNTAPPDPYAGIYSDADPSGDNTHAATPFQGSSAYDEIYPAAQPTKPPPPPTLTGSSWQSIAGKPTAYPSTMLTDAGTGMEGGDSVFTSPGQASGFLHGVREGVIDKPALGLANIWDWATGGKQSDTVRQENKQAADAGRADASNDPAGYDVGNTAGRVASQMAVANRALRAIGAGVGAIPTIGRAVAPFITGTAGEATPGVVGSILRTTAGGTSGVATGAGSALLSGEDPIRGAVEGGAFGAGGSALAQGIERALRTLRGTYVPPDVRTPSGTWQASDETAQRATQAQTLLNEGVPVMARQVSKDPGMLPTDAPWSGASGDLGNQQQAYRRAALAKVTGQGNGSSTTAPSMATDQFVTDQGTRIGGNFQAVANRNDIDFATNLAPQLTSLGTELSGVDPATRQAIVPYLRTLAQSVSRDPVTGAPIITGQKYLDLTNSNSPLQTLAGSDGLPAQYAQRIVSMLHDGLAASASPADQALLAASRQQYRALQAVKAARGSDGSFQPDDLFGATEAQSKRYGGSSGTLDPLAKAGTTVLQPSYGGGAGRTVGGIASAAGGGVGLGGIPAGLVMAAGNAAPGLLGALGAAALPAGIAGLGLPLALQAANRNPEAVARAIRTLQGAPNLAPYALPRRVVAPGVAATQQ